MAESRQAKPQLLQVGSKYHDPYNLDGFGWLAREAKAIPQNLVGDGDVSRMASMVSGLASNNEGIAAPACVAPGHH